MEGALTAKISEEKMLHALGELLLPGENLIAAIYCVFKDTGFFASNLNTKTGYLGITDHNRLIGWQIGLLDTVPFAQDFAYLSKLKLSGGLLGQKSVYMEFLQLSQKKPFMLKFQYSTRILGSSFPHQQENTQILYSELQARQSMLPKK